MLGSETMMQEWAIGTQVGSPILNILDSGLPEGSGYVPYDDEGTRTRTTYLILAFHRKADSQRRHRCPSERGGDRQCPGHQLLL